MISGTLFGVFVTSFKMKKFPLLLILSAHFVVTNQLEQEKRSMKKFLMSEGWEKAFPEHSKRDSKIGLGIDDLEPMMPLSLDDPLKRTNCLSSCDIGSLTRKKLMQVSPFHSKSLRRSSDMMCVRRSCINRVPVPSASDLDFDTDGQLFPDTTDSYNDAEDELSLKNFLKDSGWEEIFPELITPSHKKLKHRLENKGSLHLDFSMKHQISVKKAHEKKPSALTKLSNKWENHDSKPKIVFESMHSIKKIEKPTLITIEGHWMPWSLWSICTTACNVGTQSRRRICVPINAKCKLSYIDKRICIIKTCHQGDKQTTLKILQGRDAALRCYGRNIDMKHLGLIWITPYGHIIRPSNNSKSRFQADGDYLRIRSVQKIDSGLYHCIWPPFKTGTGLWLDVETCESFPCKNSGNCLESFIEQSLLKKTECLCTRKYRGSRCDRLKSTPRKTGIMIIAIIVCALFATIIFLCCCLRRRAKQELPEREIIELYLNFDPQHQFSLSPKAK